MDRISELSQPILHHILSLLSQEEAVQTCVLSKSWRYLGITRPNIEFHENKTEFPDPKKEKFMSVVDKTLQRYHDRKLSIQELTLELYYPVGSQSTAFLEKWIVVHYKGLKMFNLKFNIISMRCFSLPSVIFQAESLEELYLEQCNLKENNSTDKVLFKHLRTLFLKMVCIAEETFNKILSSCPLIEYVVLNRCEGLTTIKVNEAHFLKRFECRFYKTKNDQRIIEINSQTLETICINEYRNWNHHNMYFPHLMSLCLKYVRLSTKSFYIFSCNFPCLEELKLVSCDGFEEFQLSSPSIKRLTISGLKNSIKADIIDAPNILYFEFSGDYPPSSFSFTTTSNEWKSHIHLTCRVDSINDAFSTWFLKLNELLKALSQSQISLNLYCYYYWRKQTTEDTYWGSYKPVEVEHFIASEHLLSSYLPYSLNYVFRTCRPRYIIGMHSLVDAQDRVDSLRKIFLKERETTRQLYFWLQYLKEVSMEIFDENAKEWRPVQGTSLSECALPNNQYKQEIRFRLKWRES